MRWPDMKESWVIGALEDIEARHVEWKGVFTTPLRDGAPENWQLKWTSSKT